MQTPEDLLATFKHLCEKWRAITLMDFQNRAIAEESGIVYEALSEWSPRGVQERLIIIGCIVGSALKRITQAMDFRENEPRPDWGVFTLADAALVARKEGIAVFSLWDDSGERTSMIPVAATPDSISILESLFQLK